MTVIEIKFQELERQFHMARLATNVYRALIEGAITEAQSKAMVYGMSSTMLGSPEFGEYFANNVKVDEFAVKSSGGFLCGLTDMDTPVECFWESLEDADGVIQDEKYESKISDLQSELNRDYRLVIEAYRTHGK